MRHIALVSIRKQAVLRKRAAMADYQEAEVSGNRGHSDEKHVPRLIRINTNEAGDVPGDLNHRWIRYARGMVTVGEAWRRSATERVAVGVAGFVDAGADARSEEHAATSSQTVAMSAQATTIIVFPLASLTPPASLFHKTKRPASRRTSDPAC